MQDKFTKIGTFQYSSEAYIIKGKLESQGLHVFMADNFTIDADPLVSNAIGGVKLFVYTEDVEEANTILKDVSLYSVDDTGNKLQPVKTVRDKKSFWSFLFGRH